MSISLKKAYSACLWLAERKLGIPVEEQRGEWDIEAKDSELDWSREELISALPYEYFENSLYDYYTDLTQEDEIEIPAEELSAGLEVSDDFLTLEADVYKIFNDIQCDTSIAASSDDEVWDNAESNKLHCIDLSNIVSGPIFTTEFLDNFVRYSPVRTNGDLTPEQDLVDRAETIPSTPKPYLSIDDKIDNLKASKELVSTIAHRTLLDLLQSGQLEAWGYRDITYLPEVLTQGDEHQYSKETIEPSFWHKNPIPNYEISAVEHGVHRGIKIAMTTSESGIPIEYYQQISKYDYWIKNIQISDNFQPWLMKKVREAFPTPERATFKPQGKGYLVQFGTDKAIEVKANSGMKLIYKLLKDYCTPNFRDDFGYSIEMMIMDEHEEEVADFEVRTPAFQRKMTNVTKYIRKQNNLIFWHLFLLKDYELSQLDESQANKDTIQPKTKEVDEVKTRASILNRLSKIHSIKQKEIESLDKEMLNHLLDMDPDQFMSIKDKIKEHLKVELSEGEKNVDKVRKNIGNAVKGISSVAPHFAYFLGTAKSKSVNGIGYNNDLFYFATRDNIEWDFG